MSQIHFLFTVNSSLLVWTGRTKLLIDGLHGPAFDFSPMTPTARRGLAQGIPPFDRVDYLLFTHGHPDHFSLSEAAAFLSRHTVAGLILPPDSGQPEGTDGVLAPLLPASTSYFRPQVPPWETCVYQLGDFKVTYLHAPHIKAPVPARQHYSILLEHGSTTVFIGGDAGFPSDEHLACLTARHIDYGFFIPFYLFHRDGQRVITSLRLKMAYIYHIPYRRPENQDFLSFIQSSMDTHAAQLAPITLLAPDAPAFTLE